MPTTTLRTEDRIAKHHSAFAAAEELMAICPELETTSVLKECASNEGIPDGAEMEAFVIWARRRLGWN